MSMTDLTELRNEIMQEVYEEAEPGLDFKHLLENSDEYPDDWYSQHYLPADKEKEIFEKHAGQHDLTSSEHADLALTCITSLGPSNTPLDE